MTRILAGVALAGVALSAIIQVLAPLLRPDIDFVRGELSRYAVGPWGWLSNLGLIALGVGTGAAALALLRAGIASPWLPAGALLLIVAALACIATALYPMGSYGPSTMIGDAHQTAATLAASFLLAAILVLVLAFHADPVWQGLYLPGLLLLAVGIPAALGVQIAIWHPELGVPFGLIHRAVALPLLLWMILVSLRLWQITRLASQNAGAR
jgi:hypothetical protein